MAQSRLYSTEVVIMRRGRRADRTKNSPLASTVLYRFTSENLVDQLIL